MNAAWVGYTLLLGGMLSAAAWAADAALRGAGKPVRWVWALAMAALIAGSVMAALPRVADSGAPVLQAKAVSTLAGATRAPSLLDRVSAMRDAASVSASAVMVRVADRLPVGTGRLLLLAWLLASGGAAIVGAAVHRRIERRRRRWPVATVRGERVRIAPNAGPAVIGIVRAEIVLPRWLMTRSDEEQAVVVAHEREHQRSADHLLLGAACACVALMPWHPAAWWMLARLRLALELDCDARVIARGLDARRYGGTLIDLAGHCDGFRLGATALADHITHLERRLRAMSTSRKVARSRVVLGVAVATLAVVVACEARVPTSAEVQAMDVQGAEQAAMMKTAMPDMANAQFYVDGKRVTSETAHALPADHIATMAVELGIAGGKPKSVYITTTDATLAAKRNAESGSGLRELHMKLHDALLGTGEALSSTVTKHDTVAFTSAGFAGLVFVDGVRSDLSAIKTLGPNRIARVEVLKSAAATKEYTDPAAKNGVLRIFTKE